jgi:hypothetical protein
MSDYPYTLVTGRFEEFSERLRKTGVPDKATYSWLQSLGYTSSNDRSFIKVLKFLDFASSEGKPKERWMDFRGRNYEEVMAEAVQESYSELFNIYPDACSKEASELNHFFSSRSTAGERTIEAKVQTFKVLCQYCDFGALGEESKEKSSTESNKNPSSDIAEDVNQAVTNDFHGAPDVHIDVQVHISPDSSPEQIDQIFASMAKHLYDRDEE